MEDGRMDPRYCSLNISMLKINKKHAFWNGMRLLGRRLVAGPESTFCPSWLEERGRGVICTAMEASKVSYTGSSPASLLQPE